MKCKECDCCKLGWFESKPNEYVCVGVKHPFVIEDINIPCTEYKYKREATREDAIKNINSQLEDGYLDIGGTGDELELSVVKEAMNLLSVVERFNEIGNPGSIFSSEEIKKIINK